MHAIYGTDASETIQGTYRDDIVISRAGDDFVFAHGGNDELGDLGLDDHLFYSDYYYGGSGSDEIMTHNGFDYLFGNGGNDKFISFNPGSYSFDGGSGEDIAKIWIHKGFVVILDHHNEQGNLDHLMLSNGFDLIDIVNVEHVKVHDTLF